MEPASPWPQTIDEQLLGPIVRFAEGNDDLTRTVFLTGSYVRRTHNPRHPNVNVYFISEAGKAAELRLKLGELWHAIGARLSGDGVAFLVDCHPYTVTMRDPRTHGLPTLTLTTKVLDAGTDVERYSLSPTIGLGWHLGNRLLYGDSDALAPFGRPPSRNLEWFQGVHEALGHYRNILDHLPWALPWVDEPTLLVVESLRYAEEAIRDGAAVVLTADELRRGYLFEILFDWAGRAEPHFHERYGPRGVEAVESVANLKRAVDDGRTVAPDDARRAWLDALSVWQTVWDQFQATIVAEYGDMHAWLRRVNAFV
jgi:hypothetical protein